MACVMHRRQVVQRDRHEVVPGTVLATEDRQGARIQPLGLVVLLLLLQQRREGREIARNERVARSERAGASPHRLARERLAAHPVPRRVLEAAKVVINRGDVRMHGAERALGDAQRALIERPRLEEPAGYL